MCFTSCFVKAVIDQVKILNNSIVWAGNKSYSTSLICQYKFFRKSFLCLKSCQVKIEKITCLNQWESYNFRGESDASAEILSKEVIDYNIIWQRSQVTVSSRLLQSSDLFEFLGEKTQTVFITSFGQESKIDVGAAEYQLADWESLRIELFDKIKPLSVKINIESKNSSVIVTQFEPIVA